MTKKAWSEAELDKLKALKGQGMSDFEVAKKMGRTFESVNAKITRLRLSGAVSTSTVPPSPFPLWDEPLKSEGDAVIISDLEAPFQHSEFVNRVLELADAWGIQTLHLDGDLLHNDSLSAWGAEWTEEKEGIVDFVLEIIDTLPAKKREAVKSKMEEKGLLAGGGYSDEMAAARKVFNNFNSFKEIYVALGNHDDRYLRALDQALSPKELLHQLDRHSDERWKIAPYYYTLIETEQGLFRSEHPRGAGKNAAIDLAIQYHSHIVMGHSHRWNISRDPSGKYWAIQTGHCVDERRLAYVQQRSSRRDAHVLGATIIRNGYPFVLSPETPWDLFKRM